MDMILFPILNLIQEISHWGPTAKILTREGTLAYVIEVVESVEDVRDEILPVCLEILWNVLEASANTTSNIHLCATRSQLLYDFRHTNGLHAMGTLQAFKALHRLFHLLLLQGYRKQDKELRYTITQR
jgi:hypothetical protein